MIRGFQDSDLKAVTTIFNHYVENATCTFQLKPFSLDEIRQKAQTIQKTYPFLVMEQDNQIIGFAYGARWREKQAYDLSVETTIYMTPQNQTKGLGKQLYKTLIDKLGNDGFHLIVACLTLPNDPSIRLHEKLGFTKVGEFTQAGFKFNKWHNVGFWQKQI